MSTFSLNCLLLNEDPQRQSFYVKISESEIVSILKKMIKEEIAAHLDHLDASDLILWKLRTPIPPGPAIGQDVRAVQVHLPVEFEMDERNDYVQPLHALKNVSDYWEDSPQPNHLHILVQKPAAELSSTPERPPRKRVRLVEPLHTPIKTQAVPPETQYTPPRLYRQGFETEMAAALEPFNDYRTYLASGKLDTYFNSTEPAAFTTDLKVTLPTRPTLLLHDL